MRESHGRQLRCMHPCGYAACSPSQVHLHSDELVVLVDRSARSGPLRPQSELQEEVLQICSMFSDVATVTHFAIHYTDTVSGPLARWPS